MMMGKANAYYKPLSLTYSLRGNRIQNPENDVRMESENSANVPNSVFGQCMEKGEEV